MYTVPDSILPETFLGYRYTRESKQRSLGWQSGVLTTMNFMNYEPNSGRPALVILFSVLVHSLSPSISRCLTHGHFYCSLSPWGRINATQEKANNKKKRKRERKK